MCIPFIHKTDQRYDTFAALTNAEVTAELLTDSAGIGYRDQWNSRLTSRGYQVTGHLLKSLINESPK